MATRGVPRPVPWADSGSSCLAAGIPVRKRCKFQGGAGSTRTKGWLPAKETVRTTWQEHSSGNTGAESAQGGGLEFARTLPQQGVGSNQDFPGSPRTQNLATHNRPHPPARLVPLLLD